MAHPLKIKKTVDVVSKKSLFSFLKKNQREIISEYSAEYYKDFFLSNAEYEHYKAIDDSRQNLVMSIQYLTSSKNQYSISVDSY